jgi:hypothetical protein
MIQNNANDFNLCVLGLCHWIQFLLNKNVPLSSIYVSWDYLIEFNLCFMWFYHWAQFMLHGTIQLSSIYVSCDSTIEDNLSFLGLSHWVQFLFHVTLPLNVIYVSWLCHWVQRMLHDYAIVFNLCLRIVMKISILISMHCFLHGLLCKFLYFLF